MTSCCDHGQARNSPVGLVPAIARGAVAATTMPSRRRSNSGLEGSSVGPAEQLVHRRPPKSSDSPRPCLRRGRVIWLGRGVDGWAAALRPPIATDADHETPLGLPSLVIDGGMGQLTDST